MVKTHEKHFGSVSDLMNAKASDENEHNEQSHYSSGLSWLGVNGGIKNLKKEVSTNWQAGAKKAAKIRNKIAADIPPAKSIKRKRVFNDNGDDFHLDRLYNGDIDSCFSDMQKRESSGSPIIKIHICCGGCCNLDAEELFYQGITAAILTDVLENAGYRVELQGFYHASNAFQNGHSRNVTFDIKKSDEVLTFSKLVTVTALAGFFRYYGFKAYMSYDMEVSDNLGRTITEPFKQDKNDIALGGIYSESAAIKKIQEVLKRFNE